MKNICIFASGAGTNAERIIEHFKNSAIARVALIISNRKDAGVLAIAKQHNIPSIVIDKKLFYETESLLQELSNQKIDLIVLAGFMLLIPSYLVKAYPNKMVNIHPALLPNYGGKGMYGMHVHEAVLKNQETQSGITIHYVNEQYDEGQIILQTTCSIDPTDTPETLAQKIHALEYENYANVIERLLSFT